MRDSPIVGILSGIIVVLLLVVYSMGMKIKHISGNRDDGVREKLAAEEKAFACTSKVTDLEIALKDARTDAKKVYGELEQAKADAAAKGVRIESLQKDIERLQRSAASVTVPAAMPSAGT
jgi:peptidoglycan hydrolase CwlO-like protein